ncbi:MAG: DNA-directed RNA polymerase subunit alpha [bacterium]|nr:DNA-directed RNA polymerase subunit alpha [bacterium]
MLYDINLPEIKENKVESNKSTFIIEPLYPGYGMTLGNSMRRVLLSSLSGAAVTAVKIDGVSHEFSTIKGIKEDVVEIILNLKQLRIKYHDDEPTYINLNKKGKGIAKASDIKAPSSVEIINKDLEIANLDNESAKLNMEIKVERGRGYIPVESRSAEKLPIGMIAVDAIYTPIKKVRYSVENTRVGQMTNLDKLIVDIETDGSLTPKETIEQAAEILVGHFQVLAGHDVVSVGDQGVVTAESKNEADAANLMVDELNFTPRTANALMNNDIKTVAEIMQLSNAELKELKGFGVKAYEEVLEKLEELGIKREGQE